MWDGSKLTLEGQVPDEAAKKTIVDAAIAKYSAGNVIDKLTIDASAKGALTVTLLGQVASDTVKAARGDEAKAFYPTATIDNQLSIAPAPAAKAEDVQCGDSVAVAATFATGSANLTNEARKLLDAVVPCIKGPFEVGGHTDNVGKPEYNQVLSERRAVSVAKYLTSKGVDAKLLTSKGYGDTTPIGDNATTEGKAKNRRIEFKKM
jgi:outer membrane protein OmpA-like peptidoglycan-associated protein